MESSLSATGLGGRELRMSVNVNEEVVSIRISGKFGKFDADISSPSSA